MASTTPPQQNNQTNIKSLQQSRPQSQLFTFSLYIYKDMDHSIYTNKRFAPTVSRHRTQFQNGVVVGASAKRLALA